MLEDGEEVHVTDLSAKFYSHFQAKTSEITSRLNTLMPSGAKSETKTTEFTSLSSEIVKLRKELVDATSYLPTYDQRKYEQVHLVVPLRQQYIQLKVLEETLSSCRTPKAKFTFKRRPAAPVSQPHPPPASEAPISKPQAASEEHPTIPSTDNLRLSSRTSAYLTLSSLAYPADLALPQTNTRSSDITITGLQGCIVNLFSSTSPADSSTKSEPTRTITALHAKALSQVVLLIPPIDGSVLLHEIHDSVVIAGCHQFRMHNSTNTIVLLHVLSNPIIEQSQGIQFSAYPTALRDACPHSWSEKPSNHTMVQDFDWIKASSSPHWSLLDASASFVDRLVQVVKDGVDDNNVESVLKEVLPQ